MEEKNLFFEFIYLNSGLFYSTTVFNGADCCLLYLTIITEIFIILRDHNIHATCLFLSFIIINILTVQIMEIGVS